MTNAEQIRQYQQGWNDRAAGRPAASLNINYRAGYRDNRRK